MRTIGAGKSTWTWIAAAVLVVPSFWPAIAGPVTRQELTKLVKEGVDPRVIVALVKKDCVAFPVDATVALELSKEVPADVLTAAIDCQAARPPAPAAPKPSPVPQTVPAPVAVPATSAASSPAAAPVPPPPAAATQAAVAVAPAVPVKTATPGAADSRASRVRLTASQDASDESGYSFGAPERCVLLVDYSGPVKVLKGGEGYAPHPAFREELPGIQVHELTVPRYWDSGPATWVEVLPGAHTLSVFCRVAWARTDANVDLEPGVDYRVLLRFNWSGKLQVVGLEPEK